MNKSSSKRSFGGLRDFRQRAWRRYSSIEAGTVSEGGAFVPERDLGMDEMGHGS